MTLRMDLRAKALPFIVSLMEKECDWSFDRQSQTLMNLLRSFHCLKALTYKQVSLDALAKILLCSKEMLGMTPRFCARSLHAEVFSPESVSIPGNEKSPSWVAPILKPLTDGNVSVPFSGVSANFAVWLSAGSAETSTGMDFSLLVFASCGLIA